MILLVAEVNVVFPAHVSVSIPFSQHLPYALGVSALHSKAQRQWLLTMAKQCFVSQRGSKPTKARGYYQLPHVAVCMHLPGKC